MMLQILKYAPFLLVKIKQLATKGKKLFFSSIIAMTLTSLKFFVRVRPIHIIIFADI